MALQPSAVRLLFSGGVDTKSDPKTIPTAKLLALENGVFTRGLSIKKRNGYEDVSLAIDGSSIPVTGNRWLGARGDELLTFTPNRAYSQQPDHDHWADAGTVYSVVSTDQPAVRTGTDQTMPDHATNGGVTAYAWEDSRGGVWWSAVDSSTGRVCRAPEQLDALGQRPRCCACGDAIHVYWANATVKNILVVVVNPTTPGAAVTPAVLVDDLNASNPSYDAEPSTYAGSPVVIAWAQIGTTDYRVGFVHPTGVIGSPSTVLPSPLVRTGALLTGPIAVSAWKGGSAAELGVVYARAGEVHADYFSIGAIGGVAILVKGTDATVEPVIAVRVAATMTDEIDVASGLPKLWAAYEIAGATPDTAQVRSAVYNTIAVTLGATLRSVGLASRAFFVDNLPFAVAVHDTTYFNTYITVRLSDMFSAVGRHTPATAAGLPTRAHLSSVPDASSVCLPYRERLISENHDKFTETGLRLISFDFDNVDSHQTQNFGRGLYMAGACPMHYDGHLWTEQGFHVGPERIVPVKSAGGAMTSNQTYEYAVWYEWTDGQGEIHRGPTSINTVVAMGVSDTEVTLTLPTLRITQKPNVRICVARTFDAQATSLNRISSLDPNVSGPNGYIANDPTVDSVTFVDQMADAVARTQEGLYTNGGILSTDPSDLGSVVAGGKSRLFYSDPSDPLVIRFSQPFQDGYGAELPPELFLRCDAYGGDVTGLANLDDAIIVTKENALNAFGGDGPLENGDSSQGGFSTPQLVTSDVGCTNPASIVLTPVGLMFQSAKGIMQCDRSRTVTYIGADVEAYNGQTIRRATLLPGRTAVIFLTDSGLTLYYDYYFRQWSTFTNHEGYDAVVAAGVYHYIRTDGRIFRETPGVYSDAGRAIKLRLETAWIKMQEYLQGFAKFWHALLLGDWKSPHQLVMQVQSDYSNAWSDPMYLDATNASSSAGWITGGGAGVIGLEPIGGTMYGDGPYGDGPYGGTPPAVYQWRAHLGLVGQAIRFRFEDFQADGQAGPSFELSELLITGGVKGIARKPFSAGRST